MKAGESFETSHVKKYFRFEVEKVEKWVKGLLKAVESKSLEKKEQQEIE